MYLKLFSENLYTLFFYFVVYALLGWCLEVAYAFYKHHRFVNRGFLYGPFCPMYGLGAIILIEFLQPFQDNLPLFFLLSFIFISLLEYLTGLLLETLFNTKWWDYSESFMNIKGRICLLFSIIWGAASVVFVKCIHPFFSKNHDFIYTDYGIMVLNLLMVYFIVDLTLTLISIVKLNTHLSHIYQVYTEIKTKLDIINSRNIEFVDSIKNANNDIIGTIKNTNNKIANAIENTNNDLYENYENKLRELKEKYDKLYQRIQKDNYRLLNAFPFFTLEKIEKIKTRINEKIHSISKN